ncbi:unnamed protein product [Arctogadus glacialis]
MSMQFHKTIRIRIVSYLQWKLSCVMKVRSLMIWKIQSLGQDNQLCQKCLWRTGISCRGKTQHWHKLFVYWKSSLTLRYLIKRLWSQRLLNSYVRDQNYS